MFALLIQMADVPPPGQIERYARWIVATPEAQERLSQTELAHAQRYAVLDCHYDMLADPLVATPRWSSAICMRQSCRACPKRSAR
jgi:hypothetical protein